MADEIRATPRNSLAALLSDAINNSVGYMKSPQRTQQLQGLGRLIESTQIPYVAENLSYDPSGRGLFTGGGGLGGTTRMRPEAIEAAMNIAPMVGPVNRGLMQATKGLPVGASIKSVDDIFAKYPNVIIDASVGKKDINLSRIVVPKEMRSQGVGTQVMNDLSEYADSIGKRITLTPSADFGGSVPRLKSFYKELGFVENKGKNKDFSTRETMYREAQPVDTSPIYPQQAALDIAQQRAALPKSQGGLGLPQENTAMQRADAMFPYDVYHGTNADIQAMSVAGKGKTAGAGAFVNDNPLVAETYLNSSGGGNIMPMRMSKEGLLDVNARGANWADITTDTLSAKAGKQRYSLSDMELNKNSATSTDELAMIAEQLGLKGVNIKNVKDLGVNSHIFRAKEYLQDKYGIVPDETWSNVTGKQFDEARKYMDKLYSSQKSTVTAVQDADMLRSRFAAFDPFRRTAAIAAAMGVAAPDLLANQMPMSPMYQDPFPDTTR